VQYRHTVGKPALREAEAVYCEEMRFIVHWCKTVDLDNDRAATRVKDNDGGDPMANKGQNQKKRQEKTNKPKLSPKEKKAKTAKKRAAKREK
jgi:hypothetical protein